MDNMGYRQQAIISIANAVVKETKPEEAILINGLVADRTAREKDDMLGFGGGFDLLLLSPILIDFLKDVGKSALKGLADHAGDKLAKDLTEKETPKLDAAKLNSLRDGFTQRLEDAGFSINDATVAGDVLTSVLVGHPDWFRSLVS
jgi:hypothetical protein